MLKMNCFFPRIMMKIQGIKYGKKLRMVGWPFIFKFSGSDIQFGDSVIINSNFWSNMLGNYQRTIIVARGGNIKIGNNVGMSGCSIYAWKKIEIGDGTIIGANTKIVDNDFHPIDVEARKKNDNAQVKSTVLSGLQKGFGIIVKRRIEKTNFNNGQQILRGQHQNEFKENCERCIQYILGKLP